MCVCCHYYGIMKNVVARGNETGQFFDFFFDFNKRHFFVVDHKHIGVYIIIIWENSRISTRENRKFSMRRLF